MIKFIINGIIVLLLVMIMISISLWWHVIRLIIDNVIIRTYVCMFTPFLVFFGCISDQDQDPDLDL